MKYNFYAAVISFLTFEKKKVLKCSWIPLICLPSPKYHKHILFCLYFMTKSPKAINLFGDMFNIFMYFFTHICKDNARQIIIHKYQTWQRNEQYFALSHFYAVFMVSVYLKNVPEIIRNKRTKKRLKKAKNQRVCEVFLRGLYLCICM